MYSSKEGASEMDLRGSSLSSKESGSRVSAIPPAPLKNDNGLAKQFDTSFFVGSLVPFIDTSTYSSWARTTALLVKAGWGAKAWAAATREST